MEVILLEKIGDLGNLGDVVSVKPGFGRNFLVPQGKALPASKGNRERFAAERAAYERRQDQARAEAQDLADKVAGVSVVLQRPAGSNDKLFGSVTNGDLADFFAAQGIDIPRRHFEISSPIRSLGEFEVTLKLHADVAPVLRVVVERGA